MVSNGVSGNSRVVSWGFHDDFWSCTRRVIQAGFRMSFERLQASFRGRYRDHSGIGIEALVSERISDDFLGGFKKIQAIQVM